MKTLLAIFFVIHILAVAGIVILLLTQGGREKKVIPKGLVHVVITALVAGVAMVGIREAQHHQNPTLYPVFNYGTIAAKLVVLAIILFLTFKYSKAANISRATWVTLLGLTVVNIALAGSLK